MDEYKDPNTVLLQIRAQRTFWSQHRDSDPIAVSFYRLPNFQHRLL
jgi:hypothetical protein